MARTRRGIGSAEVFGGLQASFGQLIVPAGVQSRQNFGVPLMQKKLQDINTQAIPTAYASGTPTMQPGGRIISPSGIITQQAVGPSTTLTKSYLDPTTLALRAYWRASYVQGQNWPGTVSIGTSGLTLVRRGNGTGTNAGPAENGFTPAELNQYIGPAGFTLPFTTSGTGLNHALSDFPASPQGGNGWSGIMLLRPNAGAADFSQLWGGGVVNRWQMSITSASTNTATVSLFQPTSEFAGTNTSIEIPTGAWSFIMFGWKPVVGAPSGGTMFLRRNGGTRVEVPCAPTPSSIGTTMDMYVGSYFDGQAFRGRILELAFKIIEPGESIANIQTLYDKWRDYVFGRYGILV